MDSKKLAARIVKKILSDLGGRSGFDHWYDDIDADIKREIRYELEAIATNEIDKAHPAAV